MSTKEKLGGRDRVRTCDPLLAKRQTRLHPLFLSLQLLAIPINRGICFRSKANPNRLKTTRSCTVRVQIGAEMNLLSSESRHRVYATHFILSFFRFFAQSTR